MEDCRFFADTLPLNRKITIQIEEWLLQITSELEKIVAYAPKPCG